MMIVGNMTATIDKCQWCGGAGTVLVIYPHTPYPQSAETATRETCEYCKGVGLLSQKDQPEE